MACPNCVQRGHFPEFLPSHARLMHSVQITCIEFFTSPMWKMTDLLTALLSSKQTQHWLIFSPYCPFSFFAVRQTDSISVNNCEFAIPFSPHSGPSWMRFKSARTWWDPIKSPSGKVFIGLVLPQTTVTSMLLRVGSVQRIRFKFGSKCLISFTL